MARTTPAPDALGENVTGYGGWLDEPTSAPFTKYETVAGTPARDEADVRVMGVPS